MAISRKSLEKYALNDFFESQAKKLYEQIEMGEFDIIIYNPNKSKPIATFGYIEIISSDAVSVVIEVKTSIRHNTFQKTLKDFEILGLMGIEKKYLFIYSSVLPQTIETYFYDRNKNNDEIEFFITTNTHSKYDHGDFQYLPTAIVSIRSNYILCQDLVVNNRDMYGYTAYRYTYPVDNKVHIVSSIQLFLGMIMEDCSANNDKSKIDDTHELAFDSLQIIYDFGLWNL